MSRDGKPWVDLRHSMTHIIVLIENPGWPQARPDGDRYVDAELDLSAARHLRDDLIRRVADIERLEDDMPTPDYEALSRQYREHLATETDYIRATNARRKQLERETMRLRKLLEPFWDAQSNDEAEQ